MPVGLLAQRCSRSTWLRFLRSASAVALRDPSRVGSLDCCQGGALRTVRCLRRLERSGASAGRESSRAGRPGVHFPARADAERCTVASSSCEVCGGEARRCEREDKRASPEAVLLAAPLIRCSRTLSPARQCLTDDAMSTPSNSETEGGRRSHVEAAQEAARTHGSLCSPLSLPSPPSISMTPAPDRI